jgi:arginyl-tRNA synthetase
MSTRKGNVVFLEDLIQEAFTRTKNIIEEKGQKLDDADIQAIAVGAMKYSYISQDLGKDITFEWDRLLAFDGNSGPYIQYTFVRAKNIIIKASEANISINIDVKASENLTSYDVDLMKILFRFDEAVLDAATKYKPHILAQYCFSLANAFNSFYVHTPKILEETNESLKSTRLALVEKTKNTLKKGFELLAIKMPSKM